MTTTLRQIARIHLIGYTITNYDIELSHPCQAIRRRLCLSIRRAETHSRHTRTSSAAASAAGPLPTSSASSADMARPVAAHYGKPPCIPPYRDNHAPRLSMFGTPRRNTLRGPPDAQRDASSETWIRRYRRPANAVSTRGSGDGSPGSRRKRTEEKRDWGDRP